MSFLSGLSPVLQALVATLFTYGVTAAGAGVVLFFRTMSGRVLDVMMGGAAGVMIAASFWSLIAPALELAQELGRNAALTASIGFLAGGGFVMGSEVLLSRAEFLRGRESTVKRTVMLVGAITLHNIPEGLAVGVAFGCAALGVGGTTLAGAATLALGIGLQNFPEGVCAAMPPRRAGAGRFKSFMIGQASGLVEPIAGVFGVLFALSVRSALPLALTFSAGAMISVVCMELIPESFRDNKLLSAAGVLLGFVVMMVLDVTLG